MTDSNAAMNALIRGQHLEQPPDDDPEAPLDWRRQWVADTRELTPALARRLRGHSLAELVVDADRLTAEVTAATDPHPPAAQGDTP